MTFYHRVTQFNHIKALFLIVVISLGVSACKQLLNADIVKYADKSTYLASEVVLKRVDRTFYRSFSVGEWTYNGASSRFGEVNAYIKMPQQLNVHKTVQTQYLQQIICPSASDVELWHALRNISLNVHLYTTSKQQTISAPCINPLKKQTV